jgi:hypothetical protein
LKDSTDERQFGLIAEEVNHIIPNIVNKDKDSKPFSINYIDLVPALINELQKLQKRVEYLELKK